MKGTEIMNKTMMIFVAGGLLGASSFAAETSLPPFYETANAIQAIVSSPEVARELEPAAINSISREGSSYLVVAGQCALTVNVKCEDNQRIGPCEIVLEVGHGNCLPRP